MARDPRWENVRAMITTWEDLYGINPDNPSFAKDLTVFRIEVRYGGDVMHAQQILNNEDLLNFPDEVYRHLLNEMVKRADEELDKRGHTR